jgi:hypothetical protein
MSVIIFGYSDSHPLAITLDTILYVIHNKQLHLRSGDAGIDDVLFFTFPTFKWILPEEMRENY